MYTFQSKYYIKCATSYFVQMDLYVDDVYHKVYYISVYVYIYKIEFLCFLQYLIASTREIALVSGSCILK